MTRAVAFAERGGLGQQLFHAGIRIEWLALDDADGRDLAAHFGADGVDRLFLDDLVEVSK